MKINNFGKICGVILATIAILLTIGGFISISQTVFGENLADNIVETEYVHITPSGGLCEIEIGSDGSRRLFASYDGFTQEIKESSNGWISDDRTCIQGKLIGYLYSSPPVFEKECLGYMNKLSEEEQKEVFQVMYSKLFKISLNKDLFL